MTVIPNNHPVITHYFADQTPNMSRRTSEDLKITITPPAVPIILQ